MPLRNTAANTGPIGRSAMKKTVIFHIGLEKTGTTSIQHFCSDSHDLLLRHGLLYPTKNIGFAKHNHAALAGAYLSERPHDFTMTRSRAPRAAVVPSIIAEMNRSDAGTVVISAEHFSSRFDPPEIEALARDFDAFDTRVAVAVRNHRSRFFSSYSTYVDGGGQLHVEDYAVQMLARETRYLSVRQTLPMWQAVFGREAIDLFDYDAQSDIVPAFIGRYSSAPLGARPAYRDKTALKPSAAEAVRRVNRMVAEKQRGHAEENYSAWLQRRYFQRLLARRIGALGATLADDRWQISHESLRRIDAIAEADGVWLKEQYGFAPQPATTTRHTASVDATVPDGGHATDLLARALVEASMQGRWTISEALVTAFSALGRWRR